MNEQPIPTRMGGRRSVVNGALLGLLSQLLFLYTRTDGFSAIVGFGIFIIGILLRLVKPRPPPPEKVGERRHRTEAGNMNLYARLDFAAWGGTMVLVEVVAIILYFLFGFRLPVAPGVH